MKKVVLLAPTPPPYGGIAGWTKRMMEANLKDDWNVLVVDEKVIGGRSVFGRESKKNLRTEIQRCFKIWRNLWKAHDDKNVLVVHSCIPSGTTSMMREYVCALITKLRKSQFIIHYCKPIVFCIGRESKLLNILEQNGLCAFVPSDDAKCLAESVLNLKKSLKDRTFLDEKFHQYFEREKNSDEYSRLITGA